MFSNIIDDLKTVTFRYFPERQIYLRSGGEVSYHTLTTRHQIGVIATLAFLIVWTITTLFNTLWDHNPFKSPTDESLVIRAEYERLLEDAESRYETAQFQLTQQQSSFEAATRTFQEKHAALAQFISQPLGQNKSDLAMSTTNSGKMLMAPLTRDKIQRQARDGSLGNFAFNTGTSLDAPVVDLDTDQNALLMSAENTLFDSIELNRFIIESTNIPVGKLLTIDSTGSGGPLITDDIEDGDLLPENIRLTDIKARTRESNRLKAAVNAMPLAHPVDAENYQTSGFGRRTDPFTRRPAMHVGIDIASYRNAPIVSTADGTVKFSGRKGAYGNVVEVDHGHGFVTRYAHLAKTHVKRGQEVKKGDKLGAMGSTGRSTSTHLHYEVKFEGRQVDPSQFLKAGQYVQ